MRKFFGLAALAACTVAAPASALTFDAVTGYGTSPWEYGYGTLGGSFTPFTSSYAGGCFGVATLACMSSGGNSVQPFIGVNTGGAQTYGTVSLLPNMLILHPGAAGTNSDAILKFTAPTSGMYTVSGMIQRLDNTANGNGVTFSIGQNALYGQLATLGAEVGNPSIPFAGVPFYFAAGDTAYFAIGNNDEYTYDSTGLQVSFSVAAVPEPATWGLMILGFGVIGGAMRARRRSTKVRYAA